MKTRMLKSNAKDGLIEQ